MADKIIWIPVTRIDAERSFSQYKHLLNKQCESFTFENINQLTMLYYNEDLEKRFKDC